MAGPAAGPAERRLVGHSRSRAVADACNEEMYLETLVAGSSCSWCYSWCYTAFEHSQLSSESNWEFDVAGIAELQLLVVTVGFL